MASSVAMAGYSSAFGARPRSPGLPQKLGIKDGHAVAVLGGPPGFPITGGKRLAGTLDVIVAFVKQRAKLVEIVAKARPHMAPACGLWIAWPKKSSGVATDITEQTIRDVALPTGLVDNKVCAIDDTWSGLRLVIRKELREKK